MQRHEFIGYQFNKHYCGTRKQKRYFAHLIAKYRDIPTLWKIADCHPNAPVKLSRPKAERFSIYCQSNDIFI